MRTYQAYLLRERKLGPRTVKLHVSALRFFFVKTLKRPYMLEDLPVSEGPTPAPGDPHHGRSHPIDRWGAESDRSHDAHGPVLDGHAERRAAPSAGPRHRQSPHADSHSARQGRSRSVRARSARDCWRRSACTTAGCGRRRGCFPARFRTGGPTSRSPRRSRGPPVATPPPAPSWRNGCRPICLRHSYASHLVEAGADLRTVQLLLGHVKLEHTVIYLHLSQRHLQAVANPLDAMPVSGTDTVRRTRRLHKR